MSQSVFSELSSSLSFCMFPHKSDQTSQGHKSLESLFESNCSLCFCHCILVGQVIFPPHSDQMSQVSGSLFAFGGWRDQPILVYIILYIELSQDIVLAS